MLSTFERSWICKIKHDDNGEALAEMQITEPYATSRLGQNMYQNIKRHSLFEVIFVLFSLTHTSNDRFKINNSDEFLKRTNDKDYDDKKNDDDNENIDPTFKPTNKSKTTSNSVISLSATRSRSGVSGTTKKSLLPIELITSYQQMTPPNSTSHSASHSTSHSTSPLSDTNLPMPDFSHVNSLKIWPWEQGFLAEGRCGQVFIGAVNGIKAAVKVSFSIFNLNIV
jgi:hypothetical protein